MYNVAAMNELLYWYRGNKAGDMDLRAGLRWADWNPRTELEPQLDEAVEYFSFDFLMGIEPDKVVAYGNNLTDEESNLNLIHCFHLLFLLDFFFNKRVCKT